MCSDKGQERGFLRSQEDRECNPESLVSTLWGWLVGAAARRLQGRAVCGNWEPTIS